MTIFTVSFDKPGQLRWMQLLEVFRASVAHHMPDARFVHRRIDAPLRDNSRPQSAQFNTAKLPLWVEHMETATEPVIFADCDMLLRQPCHHAFDTEADVLLTFRPTGSVPPYNGGIVMARPTEAARAFFREWLRVNNEMYNDRPFHAQYQQRWFGMNQAALGYLWETGYCEGIAQAVPTRAWNAVNDDWKSIGDDTVFVHYKSHLRAAVLAGEKPYAELARPMREWYAVRDALPQARRDKLGFVTDGTARKATRPARQRGKR